MDKKRSKGITILSVSEILLSSAALITGVSFIIYELQVLFRQVPHGSGWGFVVAIALFILFLPLFIAGVQTFLLKPAGRALNIIALIWISLFVVPLWVLSVPLIVYLTRKDVKAQFQ